MKDFSYGIIPVRKEGGKYRFLLVRHNAGHWAFPKGHMEEGESEIKAARREFLEETGLRNVEIIESNNLFEHYSFINENETIFKTVKYFLGIVKDTRVNIQKEEISDYAWLSYEETMERLTFKEGKELLKKASKHLE